MIGLWNKIESQKTGKNIIKKNIEVELQPQKQRRKKKKKKLE